MHGVKYLIPMILIAATSPRALTRQVDVQQFLDPPSASSASVTNSVTASMVAMFEGGLETKPITRRGLELEATESIARDAKNCALAAYRPTWWLSGNVEQRRAVYLPHVAAISCEFRLPLALLDAVIAHESGYNSFATSSAGAMGMMQIMPSTARSLGLNTPWNPIANMRAGAQYLRQQIDRFGRIDLALAAYNAGPERRSLQKGYVPAIPETMNYVRTITTNWVRLTQMNPPDEQAQARAAAAQLAVQASGYREVSLSNYGRTNSENPI